jgi:hypothetical protein
LNKSSLNSIPVTVELNRASVSVPVVSCLEMLSDFTPVSILIVNWVEYLDRVVDLAILVNSFSEFSLKRIFEFEEDSVVVFIVCVFID